MATLSLSFKQPPPPERLPSRRVASVGKTPPKIPSHRATSNRIVGLESQRSSRICLQNGCSTSPEDLLVGRNDSQRLETDVLSLSGGGGGTSPIPKQPANGRGMSPDSQHKKYTNMAEQMGTKYGSRRHYCHTIRNSDTEVYSVQLVGYSIQKTVTVMAIVDVKPCQWRVDLDPSLSSVELHIRKIDANTYPMRRLLRLIHRTVPFGREEKHLTGTLKSRQLKGNLTIHREDNKHLRFVDSVTNIIPLSGSTVFADAVDVTGLPSQGAIVRLRWKEDPMGGLEEGSELSISVGPWLGDGFSINAKKECVASAFGNGHLPEPRNRRWSEKQDYTSNGGKCSWNGKRNSFTETHNGNSSESSSTLVRGNTRHGDSLPVSTDVKGGYWNLSQPRLGAFDQATPLITYLHAPAIMYRTP